MRSWVGKFEFCLGDKSLCVRQGSVSKAVVNLLVFTLIKTGRFCQDGDEEKEVGRGQFESGSQVTVDFCVQHKWSGCWHTHGSERVRREVEHCWCSLENQSEDKIVSLAKKGILMAQFTYFDLEAEIQETQPVDQLGETVVKLSGEMENMMGRMQIMEQKQGSLQDQITSMREVNSASAAVMDGIERRQKQMLDFLQQQTAESSQALQGVREQLLEQSKLIQQQATDRQETDRKEPMASQSRREEVLTQGASQFDTVLMRGHSGNVSSTPTVQSRPSFVFPPPRPPVPAHFPPHYLRRPEVFFTGPGFTSEFPVDSEEEDDSVDEESHSRTRDMEPEKMKLQREHKGQLVHDPSQEEGMRKAWQRARWWETCSWGEIQERNAIGWWRMRTGVSVSCSKNFQRPGQAVTLSNLHASVSQVITFNLTTLLVLWYGLAVMCRMFICVWQMTGSSDEERYSRFRGERQGAGGGAPGRSRHREERAGGRKDQSHSLTVVVDNDHSCTQDQRSRPRQRENWDGSRGHRGALAERRQERREQRERERNRPYPNQNLTGSRRGRSREQGQGRRAISWSQRDRQDRDQERGRVKQRGRAREGGGRQSQGGRRREHNRERTDVGASCRPGLPSHVQQVVQMGAETVSAPSRSERVPSPPSVRRVYVDEPSQVVLASFSQLRGFGGTLPSHDQMIGGPSTSTSVDEPSQVIKVSFTKLRGYGGRLPSHKQMIGGPSGSARVPVVSSTAPVDTPASAPVSSVTDQPASTGSGKKTASRECPLCKARVLVLKRHVELEHLPWYFTPELACWKCQVGVENSCSLLDRHAGCRDEVFTEKRFLQWLQTMGLLLEELGKILGFSSGDGLFQFCVRQGLYPQEKGVQLSPTREVYLLWLEAYHQRKASAVIIQPLSCLSALLNWSTMLQLLARMPEEQRRRIRDFPVHNAVWSSPQVPVTDGHCHLDLLADRWRVTCQQALQQVIEQAPHPRMLLQAVVSNCCFPKS